LIVASGFLTCAYTTVLFVRFGIQEAKLLFSRRFLLMAFNGVAIGGRYILQNIAVSQMNSSLFFVIMKTSMLWIAIFESLQAKAIPQMPKIINIATLLLICLGTVLSIMDGNADTAPIGIMSLAFVAACLDAAGDTVEEIISSTFCQQVENQGAELNRLLVAEAFWRLVMYVVCLFITNGQDVLDKGLTYGWTWHTLLFAALPVVLKGPVFTITLFKCGALAVNMACCFDMGAAYGFELLFGLRTFSIVEVVLVLSVAGVLMSISAAALDVHRQLGMLRERLSTQVRTSVEANIQASERRRSVVECSI